MSTNQKKMSNGLMHCNVIVAAFFVSRSILYRLFHQTLMIFHVVVKIGKKHYTRAYSVYFLVST